MSMEKLEIFTGIKIWNETESSDFWVENGVLIQKTRPGAVVPPKGTVVRSFNDLNMLPSGVDVQVHLRTPGQSQKETPITGLRAALYGGYGAVLSMPNSVPTLDNPESLRLAKSLCEKAEKESGVKALFTSSISKGIEGRELVNLVSMAKNGAAAFTDDGKGVEPDEFMIAAFKASSETGLPVLQHAEWPGHGGVLSDSRVCRTLGLKPYDRKQEWSFVERDLKLLKGFPQARYHVLHVTTRETVDLILRAKEEGLLVTGEASPHHLFFCADDIDDQNTSFKMNPPLHQNEDRAAIRKAINDGVLDFVATDHAPHESSAKGKDFKTSAYGTIGLESSLRVLLTGIKKGWLRADRLQNIFSSRPASFLGLEGLGEIKEGKPFRAILFDSRVESPFGLSDIQSLSKNSCFLGSSLSGKLVAHYSSSGLHVL